MLPRARRLRFRWVASASPQAHILLGGDAAAELPEVVCEGDILGVGTARLDNRREVCQIVGCPYGSCTDLELVVRYITSCGGERVADLLGDFAFVLWDASKRQVLAADDALGVQRLYYSRPHGLLAFASRAEALATEGRYDLQYLAEMLVLGMASHSLTPYAGVHALPPASTMTLVNGNLNVSSYWEPSDFPVDFSWEKAELSAIATCRELLTESVRQRMGGEGETWAQLSGGLDSSSVVCVAQWLAAARRGHGLAGTVTFVDRDGTRSDERAFSDVVAERWQVRNQVILDSPTWYDEHHEPPHTDHPCLDLQVYPRQRRLVDVVRQAGGRVLLTGWGGDEIFVSNMFFFADWIARGRVWAAVSGMARRAAIGRTSFWEMACKNAIMPLLPAMAQRRLARDGPDAPSEPWLEVTRRRYGLTARSPLANEYAGRVGEKYHHAIAAKVRLLPAVIDRGLLADALELRHPMLYRPLVEFALSLPPVLRSRPYAHRWVLREAMHGLLPDKVRARIGKPETGDMVAWSFSTERSRLRELVHNPILGDLGLVEPARLQAAFDDLADDTARNCFLHAPLLITLAVEAWLRLRSGRWLCDSRLLVGQ